MLSVVLLLALAPPTPADVHASEEARVLAPLTNHTQQGWAYLEFAPTVEIRKVKCASVTTNSYECTYEARLKDYFRCEFSSWTARRARLLWYEGCWRLDST